jgi:hypothetical protein
MTKESLFMNTGIIWIAFLLLMTNPALATHSAQSIDFTRSGVERFYPELESMKITADLETTNQVEQRLAWYLEWSVYGILKRADSALRMRGMDEFADEIWLEWDEYRISLQQFAQARFRKDLGDHKPLSIWLANMYTRLSAKFGQVLTQAMHLDDLNIINFALPVVFYPDHFEIDQYEYARHFVPLSGVFTYWVLLGICELSVPIPVVNSFCETGALVGQQIMISKFSRALSDFMWNRYNH